MKESTIASKRLRTYYVLTKPGIVRGNAITAAAGFLLASKGHPDFLQLLAMLAGLSLVIASGCVFNNYIDRGIDARMERTRNRPLVTGEISGRSALMYGSVLGIGGLALLAVFANVLTAGIAAFGLAAYVVLYGWGKRQTVHGTVIGSISGAVPPVVGYCAVTGQIDVGALILFIILVSWQMPHFYAIAIFRKEDYAKAAIPVLPLVSGFRVTKLYILGYILLFITAVSLLKAFGYAGWVYLAVVLVMGVYWLAQGLAVTDVQSEERWAKKMFGTSLVILLVMSVVISAGAVLP